MNEKKVYVDVNSNTVDCWVRDGWKWGTPIDHETYKKAKEGEWTVVLTPTVPVPRDWFPEMKNAKVLGLASGGGQQMPIFQAAGADCTILDYSQEQLNMEMQVAEREGYDIECVRADMTKPLPFEDESFDLIFHPVSNCYVEEVYGIWKECYRVLKKGGILLAGVDNGLNYVYDDDENEIKFKLPYNPLKDEALYEASMRNNDGVQFSHTIEEQIGGQLKAGFILTDIFGDTNGEGRLHDHNVETFYATRAVKK